MSLDFDLETLKTTFLTDVEDRLRHLEQDLLALEGHAGAGAERYAGVLRAAHTIKGDSLSMGLSAAPRLVHALEDLLVALRDDRLAPGRRVVELALRAIDTLRAMVPTELERGEPPPGPHDELADELRRVAEQGEAALEPAPRAAPPAVDPGEGDDGGGAFDAPARQAPAVDEGAATPSFRVLRVPITKLDRLMNLAGELGIVRGHVRRELVAAGVSPAVLEVFDELGRHDKALQELALELRMVPLGRTFARFGRVVRDVAQACGKRARLVIHGADVEVDTAVAERIAEPLIHLVSNAVDHGLEAPAERIARGKPAMGTVTVRAVRHEGKVLIEVGDDGRGVEVGRVAQAARAQGLLGKDDDLDDAAAHELLFQPGLSTAAEISERSGRGVGLDAVKRSIEQLQGSVALASTPGAGTTITLRVPLTLSIFDGFAVEVAGTTYLLPVASVIECVEIPVEPGAAPLGFVEVHGRRYPSVRLGALLGRPGRARGRESLLVVTEQDYAFGVVADAIVGEQRVVARPMDRWLGKVRGLSGTTVLADGTVGLLLDLGGLLAMVDGRPRDHGADAGRMP